MRPAEKAEKMFPYCFTATSVRTVTKLKALGQRDTWKSQLVLQRRRDESKGFSPHKVDQIAEATKKENPPLIPSHAMTVELTIHEKRFLLVQRESLKLMIVEDVMVGTNIASWRISCLINSVGDFDVFVVSRRHDSERVEDGWNEKRMYPLIHTHESQTSSYFLWLERDCHAKPSSDIMISTDLERGILVGATDPILQ